MDGVSVVVQGSKLNGQQIGPWFAASGDDGHITIEGIPLIQYYKKSERPGCAAVVDDSRYKKDAYLLYYTPENTLPFVDIVLRDKASPGDEKSIAVGEPAEPESATVTVRTTVFKATDTDHAQLGVMLLKMDLGARWSTQSEFAKDSHEVVFKGVPPGEYCVRLLATTQALEPKYITVGPSEDRVVVLKPGSASLTGRVIGLPEDTSDVTVRWRIEGTDDPAPLLSGSTPLVDDGTFSVEGLTPGDNTLYLKRKRPSSVPERITIRPGQNFHEIRLPATRIEGRIIGYEETESGRNAEVNVLELTGDMRPIKMYVKCDVDENGRFAVDALPPATYKISYRDPRTKLTVTEEVVLASETERLSVELHLPTALGGLTGHVIGLAELGLDPDPRRADERVQARVFPTDVSSTWRGSKVGKIDASTGRFDFPTLEEGTYALSVRAPGVDIWQPGIEVRAGMKTVIAVELPESREVILRFTSEEPIPRGRIAIDISTADGGFYPINMSFGSMNMRETNYEGEQRFWMQPGSYIVEVLFGDENRETIPFDIPPGDEPFVVEIPNVQ